MKFASLKAGARDSKLILVSRDQRRAVDATRIAPNLIYALEHWQELFEPLNTLYDQLNMNKLEGAFPFVAADCSAPLPRSPQWIDASAFLNHGHLMERAFNTEPIPNFETIPVMYQGASDDFLGPEDDVPMLNEQEGIDFEGEFGVIVDSVPMGVTEEQATSRIRLIVLLNDWSLRSLGADEMKTGFGFLRAKPSTSFAPVAVTPDELGDAWCNGRVSMQLKVTWNDTRIGKPNGKEMNYSFGKLIQHAAHSRRLSAGTIIGSGTVSNASREAGSACLAERRVIEMLDKGEAQTRFMRFGDRVHMQAIYENGTDGPFGEIYQRVIDGES